MKRLLSPFCFLFLLACGSDDSLQPLQVIDGALLRSSNCVIFDQGKFRSTTFEYTADSVLFRAISISTQADDSIRKEINYSFRDSMLELASVLTTNAQGDSNMVRFNYQYQNLGDGKRLQIVNISPAEGVDFFEHAYVTYKDGRIVELFGPGFGSFDFKYEDENPVKIGTINFSFSKDYPNIFSGLPIIPDFSPVENYSPYSLIPLNSRTIWTGYDQNELVGDWTYDKGANQLIVSALNVIHYGPDSTVAVTCELSYQLPDL